MIRNMIDEYRSWLKGYIKTEGATYKHLAIRLRKRLEELKSIGELQTVLSEVSRFSSPAFFTDSTVIHADRFLSKFNSTLKTVAQLAVIEANRDRNLLLIEHIFASNTQTKNLIYLLKKIFVEPRSYLYTHILNLSAMLQKESKEVEMQMIIRHLEQQPQKQPRKKPRPGSFDAVIPLDAHHEAVLSLLRNNEATYSEKCPESIHANHLLQTLLILYQTIYTPPVRKMCIIS